MKTKFFIIAAVFSIALSSCKKGADAKNDGTPEAPKAEVKENFSVDLDVVSTVEDNFALYYTEDNSTSFSGDKAAWNGVKAEPGVQTVTLTLSEEIIPTDIRLDFGLKKGAEQGEVTLQQMKINYYGKSFVIKGSDFLKYFIPNKDVPSEIDAAKGTIKFLKDPKGISTHFYYPQQTVLDEVAKLTK
jgi:hypothetical protein